MTAKKREMLGQMPHKESSDDPLIDDPGQFGEEILRLSVTDVLDLHSIPARDVSGVVEEYLYEAHRLGLRALRIIHGRGIGVQREMVRKICARTEFVVEFGDAPAEAGGWGATVITLRDG